MNELYNCIPLDSEDVRKITCLYRLYKRIRDKGYTTSQIEHDVHSINRHIQQVIIAAQEGKTNTFGKCFFVEQEENLHCELEDLYAIFSLYGFKCEFDSAKNSLRIEWESKY